MTHWFIFHSLIHASVRVMLCPKLPFLHSKSLFHSENRMLVHTTGLMPSSQSNATSIAFSCILTAYPNHTPFPLRIPQRILWSSNLCRDGFFGGKHTRLELSAPNRQQQPPNNPDQHRLDFCVLCVLKCRNHKWTNPVGFRSFLGTRHTRRHTDMCSPLVNTHFFFSQSYSFERASDR